MAWLPPLNTFIIIHKVEKSWKNEKSPEELRSPLVRLFKAAAVSLPLVFTEWQPRSHRTTEHRRQRENIPHWNLSQPVRDKVLCQQTSL